MTADKPIFIHIPKTGGTSINCMMQNTEWQTTPDFHYRHLIYETKRSNCGDMFTELGKEKFREYYIFTMLRHPVDRLVSEYYFLRQHPEFMALLSREPRDFDEFITLPETANYMLKFFKWGSDLRSKFNE